MEQKDLRLLYREMTTQLRSKYNPHFNLYQKQQLEEKVKCYKTNQDKPDQYYKCISDIDEKMTLNSQTLQKKYAQIEIKDKDCQNECERNQPEENAKNQCLKKCMEQMKDQCFKLQNQFYESMLKDNPEYKSIKS
ncbi:hypothetical protein pb186bvf_006959 [Paramecium bursaria]